MTFTIPEAWAPAIEKAKPHLCFDIDARDPSLVSWSCDPNDFLSALITALLESGVAVLDSEDFEGPSGQHYCVSALIIRLENPK